MILVERNKETIGGVRGLGEYIAIILIESHKLATNSLANFILNSGFSINFLQHR